MSKSSRPYKPELLKALQDPVEAAEYLNAALEEDSNEIFLLALRNVAEAHGMKRLAQDAQLNRVSMYRMLSDQGNPQFASLTAILKQLGLKLRAGEKHRRCLAFRYPLRHCLTQ
jgi:probable addiction module antidote protein